MSKYRQGYKPQRSVQKYDDVNLLESALRGLFSASPLSPDNPIHEKSRELKRLKKELLAKGEVPHQNTEYLNIAGDIANSVSIDSGGLLGKIKVYHGGGSLFDEWDFGKALSGEGAVQYGHGAYLAENPKVGQGYQQQMASKQGLVDTYRGKPLHKAYDDFAQHYNHQLSQEKASVLEDLGHGKLYDEVLQSAKDRYKEDPSRLTKSLLNWVEKDLRKNYKSGGYLYEMELKHRPRDYLQHDLLFNEQPRGVQNKLRGMSDEGLLDYKFDKGVQEIPSPKPELFVDEFNKAFDIDPTTRVDPNKLFGADIYWGLNEKLIRDKDIGFRPALRETSRLMSEQKIPGIRFKDQGSRGHTGHPLGGARLDRNKPSYNYVVFPTTDPDIIKVKGLLQ